jgi:hypothetical protein
MLLACLSLCAALTGEPRVSPAAERARCVSRPEQAPCAPAQVAPRQWGGALQRARAKRDASLARAAWLPAPEWSATALRSPTVLGYAGAPSRNGSSRAPPGARLRD